MAILLLIPVILSLLLIAAHFLRTGHITLAYAAVAVNLLLWIPRRIIARLFQVLLVLAGLTWIRTAWIIAHQRMERAAPWTRMAIILGSVAAVAMLSALVFQLPALQRRYRRAASHASVSPVK